MRTVSIHQAKTHLSRLVDEAAKGNSFVITKADRPLVKVMPVDAPAAKQRLGFLRGRFKIPEDFDRTHGAEIERLFGTKK